MTGEEKNEPIDLQRKKVIRELREELGGLFGIEEADIEKALDRLMEGRSPVRSEAEAASFLPPEIQETMKILDSLEALLERVMTLSLEGSTGMEERILELVEHTFSRMKRIVEEYRRGGE